MECGRWGSCLTGSEGLQLCVCEGLLLQLTQGQGGGTRTTASAEAEMSARQQKSISHISDAHHTLSSQILLFLLFVLLSLLLLLLFPS